VVIISFLRVPFALPTKHSRSVVDNLYRPEEMVSYGVNEMGEFLTMNFDLSVEAVYIG